MAEAATGIAVVSSLASTGFKAWGAQEQAKGESEAYAFKSQQEARSAKYGRLAAEQYMAGATDRIAKMGGMQDAVAAAQNIDPTSPTFNAIRAGTQAQMFGEARVQYGKLQQQAAEEDLASKYYSEMSRQALKVGDINMFSGLLTGLSGLTRSLA